MTNKPLVKAAVFAIGIIVCIVAAVALVAVAVSPFADTVSTVVTALFSEGGFYQSSDTVRENLMAKKADIIAPIDDLDPSLRALGYDSVVKIEDVQFPFYGEVFGNIKLERTGIDCDLIMGDHDKFLKKGAGVFYGGYVPGDGGTIIICAHCTSFFKPLETTEVGDIVKITTTYGDYEYEVIETRIAPATDTSTYDLEADYENLILYTCYPLNTLRARTDRFFVYGKLIKGTKIERGYEW